MTMKDSSAVSPQDGVNEDIQDPNENLDNNSASHNDDKVDYSTFRRMQQDMFKFKERSKELEDQMRKMKEADLEEKNEFKELWTKAKQRTEELEKEKESFTSWMKNDAKTREVKAELMRLGIFDNELKEISKWDLSDIPAQLTESGTVVVEGAKQWAESLKKTKPYLFKGATAPKVNPGGSGAPIKDKNDEELTAAYVASLKKKNPKLYKEKFAEYAKMLANKKQASA